MPVILISRTPRAVVANVRHIHTTIYYFDTAAARYHLIRSSRFGRRARLSTWQQAFLAAAYARAYAQKEERDLMRVSITPLHAKDNFISHMNI